MKQYHFSGENKAVVLLLISVLLSSNILAAHVDTLMVMSKAMNKKVTNLAIIPDEYAEDMEYSVLYMLHGAGDDYSSWLRISPDLPKYADELGIIIILPDGGRTSWYFDSPIDKRMKYETYITAELIDIVDMTYHTLQQKEGRAITGLSMGGHGAFYLSLRHPDIWGAAGSMSGGLDFRPFPTKWDLAQRLGSYADNQDVWDQHTVINMLDLAQSANLHLIFDCGVDDFFIEGNRQVHKKLLQMKVPHDYIERPGGHRLAYWQNALKYQLLYFHDFFILKSK